MSGIINKVKDALHKDKDHSTSTTHSTTTHSTTHPTHPTDHSTTNPTGHSTTHPTGHSTTHPTGHSTTGSTNNGPHDSNLANKADPRIDSDRSNAGAYGHSAGNSAYTNNGGVGAGTGIPTSGSTTAGPHSSNLANQADPRIDSDRSHASHNLGANQANGPHSSNLANKADPRIDSDQSHTLGAGTGGYSGTHAGNHSGSTHTGTTGGISHSQNAGPHNANAANKLDPRVDSDLDGRGNRHGTATGGIVGASGSHATAGSGTAQSTAGPHNSDLLNKVDPRVDSDRDGSKTYGGNATHK